MKEIISLMFQKSGCSLWELSSPVCWSYRLILNDFKNLKNLINEIKKCYRKNVDKTYDDYKCYDPEEDELKIKNIEWK